MEEKKCNFFFKVYTAEMKSAHFYLAPPSISFKSYFLKTGLAMLDNLALVTVENSDPEKCMAYM